MSDRTNAVTIAEVCDIYLPSVSYTAYQIEKDHARFFSQACTMDRGFINTQTGQCQPVWRETEVNTKFSRQSQGKWLKYQAC
jgi:hypothetical protein